MGSEKIMEDKLRKKMDQMLSIGENGHPLVKQFRHKKVNADENKHYVRDLKIVQIAKAMT